MKIRSKGGEKKMEEYITFKPGEVVRIKIRGVIEKGKYQFKQAVVKGKLRESHAYILLVPRLVKDAIIIEEMIVNTDAIIKEKEYSYDTGKDN